MRDRIAERLGRVLARIVLPVMRRTKEGRKFLAALDYYNDGGAAGVAQREMLKRVRNFENYPVYMRRWTAWKDEQTGEVMLSCVDARDSNRVYVRPYHSIHDPGIMSAADFEARYGASARKGKK